MSLCVLIISQDTHGLILYEKNKVSSIISLKFYVNVYNDRRENKLVRLLEFVVIKEVI